MFYVPEFGAQSERVPLHLSQALQDKHIVFTIATGRSGTNFFAELFKHSPDTLSLHESEPDFRAAMFRGTKNAEASFRFLLEQKLPAIAAIDETHYVETSHLFCKAFLSPLLELGIKPTILLIHRPAREVAKSFYEIGSVPYRTQFGRAFMLSPYDPSVLTLVNIDQFHDYQLCYWYSLEIYARAYLYRKIFDDLSVTYIDVQFPDCVNIDDLLNIFPSLNLPSPINPAVLEPMIRRRFNAKSGMKSKNAENLENLDDKLDVLEQQLLGSIISIDDNIKAMLAVA